MFLVMGANEIWVKSLASTKGKMRVYFVNKPILNVEIKKGAAKEDFTAFGIKEVTVGLLLQDGSDVIAAKFGFGTEVTDEGVQPSYPYIETFDRRLSLKAECEGKHVKSFMLTEMQNTVKKRQEKAVLLVLSTKIKFISLQSADAQHTVKDEKLSKKNLVHFWY